MSTIKVDRFENTAGVAYGCVLQVQNYQTGIIASASATIPTDNNIPQNTDGTEFLAVSITPKSSINKLKITVNCFVGCTVSTNVHMALFQDSTANALAATTQMADTAQRAIGLTLCHYMTAGTTSSTTFKVRMGPATAGSIYLNGNAGLQYFGGVGASSITIEEIQT